MAGRYRFGGVEVRLAERQVLVDGRVAPLGARAFDVLQVLIERRDRMVTKAELLDLVWPGVVVEESNVQVQVSGLRRVLGPDAIATIPGRGYRFTAPLDEAPATQVPSMPAPGPFDPDPIVGRDDDIERVLGLLAGHRLVTICGPGGIGKTRLAIACARSLSRLHADGTAWVDLSALASPRGIAAALARAASLQLGDDSEPAALARVLGDRDMILVLDNCEHLAEAIAKLATAILATAPRLRLLATSQVPLKVASEQVYRLGSLPVPPDGSTVDESRAFAALQVLERRARASDSRFALTADTVGAAIELCRHLDGMPLALEMAGARLPTLGLHGLSERLGERLRLLRSNDVASPTRQQTLRATLDWSHSLLVPAERAVLRRLSVFAGSFPLEAAQHVASMGELDEWGVLDALASLVDKSLVQASPGEPPRYRLPETTRLYAQEQLLAHEELEATLRSHGEAMARRAKRGTEAYVTGKGAPDASPYVDDYEDLAAAFERAADAGNAEVAASVSRLLNVLDFERNVHSNVRRRKEAALRLLPKATGYARAQLLTTLCLFRTILLPSVDRVRNSEERVAAWRELGIDYQVYISLARLGSDLAVERDFDGADRAFAEAAAMANPAWPPIIHWFHHYAATNAAFLRGDAAGALHWASATLDVCVGARWASRAAEARVALAHATLYAGDAEGALELARRAEAELRPMGHRTNLADALCIQAGAQATLGRFERAREILNLAVAIPRPVETALPMFDYAAWVASVGSQARAAASLLQFADRVYAENQDRRLGAAEHAASSTRALLAAGERVKDKRIDADEAWDIARTALRAARLDR